jgi:hypothetical protein
MHDLAKENPHDGPTAATSPPCMEGLAYSEDGVDLTLIRWFLSLTPTERLQRLQGHARAIWRLRRDNPHL